MGLECLFFYHAIPSTVRNLYILDEIMNEEKGKKWRESLLEVKEVAERQEIEEIDYLGLDVRPSISPSVLVLWLFLLSFLSSSFHFGSSITCIREKRR